MVIVENTSGSRKDTEEQFASIEYFLCKNSINSGLKYLKNTPYEELASKEVDSLFKDLNMMLRKITPSKSWSTLVIPIVSDCNLNCKGCDAYSPLCNHEEYDSEELFKDLTQLRTKGFRIKEISLEGGEPLLHSNLLEIILAVRKVYSYSTTLSILTNGLLIDTLEKHFLEAIKKNHCKIIIDDYNKVMTPEKLCALDDAGVEYEIGGYLEGQGWFHRAYISDKPDSKDISGINHFFQCDKANIIHTLYKGEIFTCGRHANIRYLNKFFNKNYPEKGINIYDNDGESIAALLSTPCELCKYCLPVVDKGYFWEKSSQEETEWIKKHENS